MKKIVVFGAGLVGSLIAKDLASEGEFEVVSADRSEASLARLKGIPGITCAQADLTDPKEVARLSTGAAVAVGAVPGHLGTALVRTLVSLKVPVSDISFSPEDPFLLDREAKAAGVPAIVDAGVSPGLSGLAAGRADAFIDELDTLVIRVGGIPSGKEGLWEYRSVFSPTDVIEEYTRPARVVENGRLVVKPALSEIDEIDAPGVGRLEAFLSDGLRTLLTTIKAKNLCEKTLRWPGHAERMRLLRDSGFFSSDPVRVGGVQVVPRALTEALLFETWRRPDGEEELTYLRVDATGTKAGKPVSCRWGLLDRTDPVTGNSSMARTTGFPCAAAARLLASGTYTVPGVHPLEELGRDDSLYRYFVAALAARGIAFREVVESPAA